MENDIILKSIEQTKKLIHSDMLNNFGFNDCSKLKYLCYGAGDQAVRFIKNNKFINISYILESKPPKNKSICELKIHSIEKLQEEDPQSTIIFIASSAYDDIKIILDKIGFNKKHNRINAIIYLEPISPFRLLINKSNVKILRKLQKKYRKNIASFNIHSNNLFIAIIGSRFKEFLSDVDSLYDPKLQNEAIELKLLTDTQSDEYKLSSPFPSSLIKEMINTSIYIDGSRQIASKFTNVIKSFDELSNISDLKKSIAKTNFIEDLHNLNIKIAIDKLRFIERQMYYRGCDTKEFIVSLSARNEVSLNSTRLFVVRKSLEEYGSISDVIEFFKNKNLNFIMSYNFDDKEIKRAYNEIRNANWSSNAIEKKSGPPVGFLLFDSKNINKVKRDASSPYVYRYSSDYDKKNELRSYLVNKYNLNEAVNFIHSPDDDIEALEYLRILEIKNYELVTSSFLKKKLK